jgi:hypothetical protein
MKRSLLVFLLVFLFVGIALADQTAGKPLKVTEVGKDSFQADFVSGGQLRMHIRSGELRVIGSDENKIRVNYSGKNGSKTSDVTVSLKTVGNYAELRVSGGPHNDFRIEIQVPKNSGLYLRMPAGDLEVNGLTGDKDVEIHAGDMTLGVGKADDYGHVDASVNAGDLDAQPFGVSKGGLFRSFDKHGGGKYRLHAHVGAGDLVLRE